MQIAELAPVAAGTSSPQATGTFTPSPGAVVIVVGAFSGGAAGTDRMSITANTTGLAFTEIAQAAPASASSEAIGAWYAIAPASPGTGTVTFSAPGSVTSSAAYAFQLTGQAATAVIAGLSALVVDSTSASVSMTLSQAPAAADMRIGIVGSRNTGSPATPGSGFTVLAANAIASPNAGLFVEYATGGTSTTVDASGFNTVSNSGFAFVAKAAAGGPQTVNGAASMAATATLTATGVRAQSAGATLAAASSLTAAGSTGTPTVAGSASFAAGSSLTAGGTRTAKAAASLAAAAGMTAGASTASRLSAAATLAGTSGLTAVATVSQAGRSVTRPWPGLSYQALMNQLHLSDVHINVSIYQDRRMAKVVADAASSLLRSNLHGVAETGDLINMGILTVAEQGLEDAKGIKFRADVCAALGLPIDKWVQVIGNHDSAGQFRDSAQWAATYGLPGYNYVTKLGDVYVIAIGPDASLNPDGQHPYGSPAVQLSAATVQWLSDQLDAHSNDPCVIACHTPLPEATANGEQAWTWTDAAGSAATDLLAVLDAHAYHIAYWQCGHTHVQPDSPETFALIPVGAHQIVHVNAGWIGAYRYPSISGPAQAPYRPIVGLVLSVNDDLSVVCRYRNHGARTWYAPRGATRLTLASA